MIGISNCFGMTAMSCAMRIALLTASTTFFAAGASAEGQDSYVSDDGGSLRIDMSGKLRMLSQRITANACYVNAGVDLEATTAMLNATKEEFEQITVALEFGNAELGIHGAETRPKTLATLERLHALWNPIADIADQVVAGTATQDDIAQMAAQSAPLLEMAQNLVTTITSEYSQGAGMVLRDALVIDIAGRQRMLAQRISKDVCLLATGIDTEHALDDLTQTSQLFDTSLSALRTGMPSAGIQPPRDPQVIADLDIAAADWATVQPKIADVLAGQPVDDERLEIMFALANTLTADMNEMVVHFTHASKQDL